MRIKKFREKQGLTIEAFAEICGIKVEAMQIVEQKEFNDFLDKIVEICQCLRRDLQNYFSRSILDPMSDKYVEFLDPFGLTDGLPDEFDIESVSPDMLALIKEIKDREIFSKKYFLGTYILLKIAYTFLLTVDEVVGKPTVWVDVDDDNLIFHPSYATTSFNMSREEQELIKYFRGVDDNVKESILITAKNFYNLSKKRKAKAN